MLRKLARLFGVLVIGIAGFVVLTWRDDHRGHHAPYNAAKAQLGAVEMKVLNYHLDTHELPRKLDDLLIAADVPNWRGPYAKPSGILDPWGHAIGYEIIDAAKPSFRLFVSGPKGEMSETYEP